MREIWADFNTSVVDDNGQYLGYSLNTRGTRDAIAKLAGPLEKGELILVFDEDIKSVAVVGFYGVHTYAAPLTDEAGRAVIQIARSRDEARTALLTARQHGADEFAEKVFAVLHEAGIMECHTDGQRIMECHTDGQLNAIGMVRKALRDRRETRQLLDELFRRADEVGIHPTQIPDIGTEQALAARTLSVLTQMVGEIRHQRTVADKWQAAAEKAHAQAAAAARPLDVCWHCQVVLEREMHPHCEDCPEYQRCDEAGCEEPGCQTKDRPGGGPSGTVCAETDPAVPASTAQQADGERGSGDQQGRPDMGGGRRSLGIDPPPIRVIRGSSIIEAAREVLALAEAGRWGEAAERLPPNAPLRRRIERATTKADLDNLLGEMRADLA